MIKQLWRTARGWQQLPLNDPSGLWLWEAQDLEKHPSPKGTIFIPKDPAVPYPGIPQVSEASFHLAWDILWLLQKENGLKKDIFKEVQNF